MADPFAFTPEQQDLRKGLREFLAKRSDEATARRLMDSDLGHDLTTWERLGSELGVLALAVPDKLGGAGGRLVDQAVAVEEFGAALLPGPVIGTVAYAKDRLQFGLPIGSFQAVKHRLADMLVLVEHARSAAYYAAWAIQDGTDAPALAASIAQAVCSEAAYRVAADAIQLHGGIGFTWEHPAHLYYKRAVTDAAQLGSAAVHRNRIAAFVLDTAEPDGALVVAAG
jgi:alkylation response protein AidB-like acyl-CoA dehydrogenase